MTKPLIVAVSGKRGAGKSALARVLIEDYGFVLGSFAKPLKERAKLDFCLSAAQVYGDQKEVVDPRYGMTSRDILIKIGQAYRSIDNDFWVNELRKSLETEIRPVVIDDMRFVNEANMLKGMGAMLVRLERLPEDNIYKGIIDDLSETQLDLYDGFDFRFCGMDNRTMSDLRVIAERITNVIYQNSVGNNENSGYCGYCRDLPDGSGYGSVSK